MVDTTSGDVRKLVNDIRKMGGTVSRELGKEFKKAAGPVADQAKSNASWSTRIPGAIKTGTSRSRKFPGAQIKVSKDRAPHARLYEFGSGSRSRSFRHPVYGDRNNWVEEATRPFIRPAIRAKGDGFIKAADRAVDTAAREAGFR